MIAIKGKLVYDPVRPDFRKSYKTKTLILELPRSDQTDLYYQWFIEKQYGTWIKMQRPMYGLHVAVVRGDEKIPANKAHVWKKHAGKVIEVLYDPYELERHWEFWSMTVHSQELMDIRGELGLQAFHRFHLTIGRQYPWQSKLDVKQPLNRSIK